MRALASTGIRRLPAHSQEVAVDVVKGPKILVVALAAALDAAEDIVKTESSDEFCYQEVLNAASSMRLYLNDGKSAQQCRSD